ncbi:HNH endonuclease [Arthrobacter koreensis]|uniref:HNH endonuclease n=1 Tax=Arthrobacter koreensis TaxID=199136 RepID=UPI002DBE6279|nr:DUF222 domain-containing protein [Arthrobacter koreensis]MEB7504518.1 HNH endonuclease [Arthrobacter koreensis]
MPEGFAGRLSFRGAERLGYEETVSALQRLGMLVSWAQAQQARVAARLEVLFARDIAEASGREEPALAMSLAAAEASTVLNIPHMTAMQLISESTRLCTQAPDTLDRLTEGKIALQHARIILEETHNLPADVPDVPEAGPVQDAASPPAPDQSPTDDSGQLDLDFGQDGGLGTEPSPDAPDEAVGEETGTGTDDTAAVSVALSVRGAFERDLLTEAEGRTAAGFGRRARRLRESRFPDLIPVRHREAKDKRRVMFQPLPDGMSCLSANIAAEKGQAMFAALTGAAKAGKRAGDPRTMDQLRADTLTELLLEGEPAALSADTLTPASAPDTSEEARSGTPASSGGTDLGTGTGSGSGKGSSSGAGKGSGSGSGASAGSGAGTGSVSGSRPHSGSDTGSGSGTGSVSGSRPHSGSDTGSGSGTGSGSDQPADSHSDTKRNARRPRRAERHRNQNRSKIRTEVIVLINADTLAGLDENPAELNGYGPISAETARTMILGALHWTPLLQDPATGEILNVGRTRRIPAGLKRWLQARDGTCRFPGCSVTVTHAEIDHTTPYSHGGPTEHTNLEHLCPKHHRFKTLGHWKARQPEAGTIEWNSPTGRTYTTGAELAFMPASTTARSSALAQEDKSPDDDPPPF